jgi:hypothetical protein
MNVSILYQYKMRLAALLCGVFISGIASAQYFQNPDAITLFNRTDISGSAATVGAGGAYSSVGADPGCMELNPAGLGLYKGSDICISPGLRITEDHSTYDGNTMNASHVLPEFAHAGAVFTKKMKASAHSSNPFALKSITFGINYQSENSFDRDQNFATTTQSIVNRYTAFSNQVGSTLWSIESDLMSQAYLIGQNTSNPIGSQYYSNVHEAVIQTGTLSTRGGVNKISLGMGANLGDKIFFGFSLGVPILDYTVNTQLQEQSVSGTDSVTHFQNYQLSSSLEESGVGFTGKLGMIFKPVSWMRFGISYSLPTWYFMTENYNGSMNVAYDTLAGSVGPESAQSTSYRIRTPMKGMVGASFYLDENSFLSVDYELQNMGSTHYSFSNDSANTYANFYNQYLKSTYSFNHTVRVGIQGAIKKLRLRAGYSYSSSPFKRGQNYTDSTYNQAIHSATVGIGLKFKVFYIDLAYKFTYSKDGVSPDYYIPIDQINSTYMTHTVLLTLGFKIPSKGSDNSSAPAKRQRSSDQLPRYIDPGDKY